MALRRTSSAQRHTFKVPVRANDNKEEECCETVQCIQWQVFYLDEFANIKQMCS